ncbi:MAG: DNA-binding FadR family transcriptional regulator [Myxococcota bacterium]|jgi:DNA-binding FadR family transcriptional regulator
MAPRAERKADRVAGELMRRIVGGHLEVGDLLPKEAELAAEFEVNRSVVREAIKLLEVHGLAQPIKRLGTRVLDPLASVSPGVIRVMLSPDGIRVDAGVLADLLELREQLDRDMTALAAGRRTDHDLVLLSEAAQAVRAALGSPAEFRQRSDAFAMALARASHNRLFPMLVHWQAHVFSGLDELLAVVVQPIEPHVQGIELLLECIRRSDVAAARRVIGAFHAWANPRILAAAALRSGASLKEVRS